MLSIKYLLTLLLLLVVLLLSRSQVESGDANSDSHRRPKGNTRTAEVTFEPLAERHVSLVEVILRSETEGAKIFYTLDGADPVAEQAYSYSEDDPLFIDDIGDTVIAAMATADGLEDSEITRKKYTIQDRCAQPVFVPESNETFAGHAEVTITTATPWAKIHYTLDGSRPYPVATVSDSSTKVMESGDLLILKTFGRNEVQAIAVKEGYAPSHLGRAVYYILPKVDDPVIKPVQDTFPISASLQIECTTENAKIYYTTDGTYPDRYSLEYFPDSGLTIVGKGEHTVMAFAVRQNYEDSEVVTKKFLVVDRLVRPTIEPEEGHYVGDIKVTIECPGAPKDTKVYYTMDLTKTPVERESNPTMDCGGTISLHAPGTYLVRAFSKAPGMARSSMMQAHFTLVRPKYDSKVLDGDLNAYRVRPVVDVTPVVLPPSEKSEVCDAAVNVGHLATLSNVLGHFDIAIPAHGCSGPDARLEPVTTTSEAYEMQRNPFRGDETARTDGSKEELEALQRVRYRALLPPSGAPPQQWVKWLVEFQEQDEGCAVAAAAGYFNMSSFACSGNLVAGGKVIQTSSRKNVNLGVRGDSLVVGYVPKEEILNEENPFDFLVAGSGWLVRNGASYVQESFGKDAEDSSYQPENFKYSRIARTALGYNAKGELMILQMSGESSRPEDDADAYVHGLTISEFADVLVTVGFEQAINLVGGDPAIMTVNHSLVSIPSSVCPSGTSYKKCGAPASTVACIHTLAPPINEAELDMVLPLLGPEIPNHPSKPLVHSRAPSKAPTRSPPGSTPWPTFSWERSPDGDAGDDDKASAPMLNGTNHYSEAVLRQQLSFYKGSTLVLVVLCTFLVCTLFYVCTNGVERAKEREMAVHVQHGLDSSHGGSSHSVNPDSGIQFVQISEPQRRAASAGGSSAATVTVKENPADKYKITSTSKGPVRWQEKLGTLNLDDSSSSDEPSVMKKGKNTKSKMTGKSRHRGLGKASKSPMHPEPAKVVTHSPLTPAKPNSAAASRYQQLQDDDPDDDDD
jgi:hypothetical protein